MCRRRRRKVQFSVHRQEFPEKYKSMQSNNEKVRFLNYLYPVNRSHNSSQEGILCSQHDPLDLSKKGRKSQDSRYRYSKYPRSWGRHLQEVESPVKELQSLMGSLQLKKDEIRKATSTIPGKTQEEPQTHQEETEMPIDGQ